MKIFCISLFALSFFIGCVPVEVQRPRPYLSLYDLKDGKMIKVSVNQISRNQGRMVSMNTGDESFEGEYYLHENINLVRPIDYPVGILRNSKDGLPQGNVGQEQSNDDSERNKSLPERFGFGNRTEAQPVGSAVLLGAKGTVIEIVFYHISSNLQSGDGIAKDNKGKYYRIFLGQE